MTAPQPDFSRETMAAFNVLWPNLEFCITHLALQPEGWRNVLEVMAATVDAFRADEIQQISREAA